MLKKKKREKKRTRERKQRERERNCHCWLFFLSQFLPGCQKPLIKYFVSLAQVNYAVTESEFIKLEGQ